MECLTNVEKTKKQLVLAAIEASGCAIEWRDHPDERMSGYSKRDKYGSVWTDQQDCSEFWRHYRAAEEKTTTVAATEA